ncbi:MAG: hypothetical protein HFJ29_04605 [Clostridia bacterium]|nr:hypothetical protein [Clostridia bacterium]
MEKKKAVKKVLKVIGIIVLIIIALFMINTIRKLAIIKNIQKNANQYTSSKNYHIKSVGSGMNEDSTTIINSYCKGDNTLTTLEMTRDGEKIHKLSVYDNGIKKDVFTETSKQKVAEMDVEESMNLIMPIYNYFEGASNMQLIWMAIVSRVEDIEYNGKQCYRVANSPSSSVLKTDNNNIDEVYIEKDTGLVIRTHFGNTISEREYEFNNVQDDIFTEPDIREYETLKNDSIK